MNTNKNYHITLLSKGEIVPKLHYGMNAKEWRIQALLTDVSFQPPLILLDKISINIFKIGFLSNEEWHGAGNGYLSSFSYTYKKTNCNFI